MTLLVISLLLIFIGSRATIISYSGTVTPFLDEWDGEAAALLKPYIQGRLTAGDLFGFFSEHIILFTRLTTLAIFTISGYWDVVLQMIVNAIVDAATVIGVSLALSRVLRGSWAQAAVVLCALIAAIPMSGDSILIGIPNPVLFPDGVVVRELVVSGRLAGLVSAVDYGIFVRRRFVSRYGVGRHDLRRCDGPALAQAAIGRRKGLREWLGIAALAAAAALAVGLVPHVPETEFLRPHSLSQFGSALFHLASWPAPAALGVVHGLAVGAFLRSDIRGASRI